MKPTETGRLYDRIAGWWNEQQSRSNTGLPFVQRAIKLCARQGHALDVGCGSGGSNLTALEEAGFTVTGVDVSAGMLAYAHQRHPAASFIHTDIVVWQPEQRYDLILAWDSLFHLPYASQGQVIEKLGKALVQGGVILFTVGGVDGELTGAMGGQTFYYSSLAETDYLRLLKAQGVQCVLMERDQYPEEHVVFIGVKG